MCVFDNEDQLTAKYFWDSDPDIENDHEKAGVKFFTDTFCLLVVIRRTSDMWKVLQGQEGEEPR